MKFTRLLAPALLTFPLLAQAHPGHDGDHELVWDFDHLASHPFATLACVAVLILGAWALGRAFRSGQTTEVVQRSHDQR